VIPLGNRVLLKHLEATRDELWLPESAGFLQRGVVMVVGEAARYVASGDVVMFKVDEALRMRVPVDDPTRAPTPVRSLGWLPAELLGEALPPAAQGIANEETLYLIPEPGIYLILEQAST
jgi:hypothetical protein